MKMPFKLVTAGLVQRFTVTQDIADGSKESEWVTPVNQATNTVVRIDALVTQWGENISAWGLDAGAVGGRLFLSGVSPEGQTTPPEGYVSESTTLLTTHRGLFAVTSGAAYVEPITRVFPFQELIIASASLWVAVNTTATGVVNTGHFRIEYSVGTVPVNEFLAKRVAECC